MKRSSAKINLFGDIRSYPDDPAEAAEYMLKRGFQVVPFRITVTNASSKPKKWPLIDQWKPYILTRDECLKMVANSGAFCIVVPKNLVVLDLDCETAPTPDSPCSFVGLDSLADLSEECGDTKLDFFDTVSVNTPTGGLHLWYRLPPRLVIKNSAGKLGDGLDIRIAEKGLIMMPPSVDSRGRRYEFDPDSGTNDVARLPVWISSTIQEVRKQEQIRLKTSTAMKWDNKASVSDEWIRKYLIERHDELALCNTGSRNNALNAVAYNVYRKVASGLIPEGMATSALHSGAMESGLSDHEVTATLNSAFKAAVLNPY